MLTFKSFIKNNLWEEWIPQTSDENDKFKYHDYLQAEHHPDYTQEHNVQSMLFGVNDFIPFNDSPVKPSYNVMKESVEDDPKNKKRLIFRVGGKTPSTPTTSGQRVASGLSVPRHMWEGARSGKTGFTIGMKARLKPRAEVYGGENRAPLTTNSVFHTHKAALEEHFAKPKDEQLKAEREAIDRLHRARHLDSKDTTDPGEKTDTVQNEYDEHGRSFRARSSKGIAGHALYTSGHGDNETHHLINTCHGQSNGCGGGVHNGVADTTKGNCFAPKAEAQYGNAAIRRSCHEQAKFDPAMTKDWILAHTHSLRMHADAAHEGREYDAMKDRLSKKTDGKSYRFLFRPNVVDETDQSSRLVIKHLNKQRASENKPPIVANSYGKTTEVHDPDNHYHVTYSNTGPKTKHGASIDENIKRDANRVKQTVLAISGRGANGKNIDLKNEDFVKTPAKNSYAVLNIKRGKQMDRDFQASVTHAKYWSKGRETDTLSPEELKQGEEAHYDHMGNKTDNPSEAHYGHRTLTREDGTKVRYDYQKQHILHPRIVPVKASNGKVHNIPTDSRFKDSEFLPSPESKERFRSPNGKVAGAILATTPTTSTSTVQHHTPFTHHVDANTIAHAKANKGEWEIDKPEDQEASRGNEYVPPSPPVKKAKEMRKMTPGWFHSID
jgi:hypothetical protein